MIIDITRFKEGVSESIVESLEPKELDIEYVDLHYKGKITVNGSAQKILNVLTFRGTLNSEIEHTCARCLKVVHEIIQEPINFTYDIKGLTEVDMLSDIRDVLILAHPEQFLCDASCKGLCPNCGIDLNTEQCKCQIKSEGRPFSKLRNLFEQKSG